MFGSRVCKYEKHQSEVISVCPFKTDRTAGNYATAHLPSLTAWLCGHSFFVYNIGGLLLEGLRLKGRVIASHTSSSRVESL